MVKVRNRKSFIRWARSARRKFVARARERCAVFVASLGPFASPSAITLVLIIVASCVVKSAYGDRLRRDLWAVLPTLLQVAAGAVALVWSLWQFDRSHKQRSDQFAKQQELTRTHFEQDSQRAEFADISNRLADNDASTRANAALRLGAFGSTRRVGRYLGDYGEPRPDHNEFEYPFFLVATQQLCTAINIENNPRVRDAIASGLKILLQFAEGSSEFDPIPHPFLYRMIMHLAEANRIAKTSFIRAMAEFGVAQAFSRGGEPPQARIDETDIPLIASLAPFCRPHSRNMQYWLSPAANRATILSLQAEGDGTYKDGSGSDGEFKRSWQVFAAAHSLLDQDRRKRAQARTIDNLQNRAAALISIRDILAEALCKLQDTSGRNNSLFGASSLTRVFLAGASVRLANLQGLNLSELHLQGADAIGIHLDKADLFRSNLQYADLANATLQDSDLLYARLNGAALNNVKMLAAKMSGTDLSGAKMIGAVLQRANMRGAVLREADVTKTDFQGAIMYNCTLNGATFSETALYGVHFGRDAGEDRTVFPVGLLNDGKVRLGADNGYEPNADSDQMTEELRRHLGDEERVKSILEYDNVLAQVQDEEARNEQ